MLNIQTIDINNWQDVEELVLKSEMEFHKNLRDSADDFKAILLSDGHIARVAFLDGLYIGNTFGCDPRSDIDLGYQRLGIDIPESDTIHICSGVLDHEYRGRGLGQRLLNDFLNQAREMDYKVITGFFRPNGSLHLFRRLGGKVISVHSNWHDSGEDYSYCRLDTE